MYFIKATVKHNQQSETFSELLSLATLALAADAFAEDVKEKFGEEASFVIEDVKQIF
ncbi:hypothetical protein P9389_06245 [Escherichia coli]|uniref:hypothetical protein n=1 Tax=Escherichia coli TaxID=562 RepID=UPI0004509298|nr:hypothetical protein [Escherichia coli]EZJ95160.1 hypothetical protein AB71_2935 [Escherichia coli 1-182-04_S1_C3]EZK29753.1 hypothetical protein AB12_2721 [Escherichia coli 1-182-04_S1_C1]KDA67824.1 hypothetical protein AB40_2756 [Escherichia coli 1-182-04_S1_C2]